MRAITQTHSEKLIDLLNEMQDIKPGVAKYADDFGLRPARQLEAYVRRHYRSK